MPSTPLNRPSPERATQALMAWLDPPRKAVAVDGVLQPTCQTGAQVAANLAVPPATAILIAAAVDNWLQAGRFGVPIFPPGISPDIMRVVAARMGGMTLPNQAAPLQKAITHREVHTGRTARQSRSGSNPSWKKKGYVGPGGAWATAKRKAKEAGKPESYARAIMGRMMGKSTGWDI